MRAYAGKLSERRLKRSKQRLQDRLSFRPEFRDETPGLVIELDQISATSFIGRA